MSTPFSHGKAKWINFNSNQELKKVGKLNIVYSGALLKTIKIVNIMFNFLYRKN